MSPTPTESKWNQRESYLLYFFFRLKSAEFQSQSTRKAGRVFDYFAHLVGTKNRVQVKSRHQKLMKKHETIQKYIFFFENEHDNQILAFQAKYLTNKIKSIVDRHLEVENLKKQPLEVEQPQMDSCLSPNLQSFCESKGGSTEWLESSHGNEFGEIRLWGDNEVCKEDLFESLI